MPYCHVAPEDLELLGIFSRLAKGHDPYSLLHTSKCMRMVVPYFLLGGVRASFQGLFWRLDRTSLFFLSACFGSPKRHLEE